MGCSKWQCYSREGAVPAERLDDDGASEGGAAKETVQGQDTKGFDEHQGQCSRPRVEYIRHEDGFLGQVYLDLSSRGRKYRFRLTNDQRIELKSACT